MSRKKKFLFLILVVVLLPLSACGLDPFQSLPILVPVQTPTPPVLEVSKPAPQPSPTHTLPRGLTVCLGQEPNTLYPFGTLNSAARSVLGAIYDGPIDVFTNGYQAVILEKIPTIENGEAQLAPAAVKRGDPVVDAHGNFAILDFGLDVLPSGCTQDACSIKYDGRADLKMDQLVVTYKMLPNLTWSDGQKLTADDSLFAFELASAPATPGSKYLIDRTASYEAVDDLTVQWWGVPGFVDPTYQANFWSPLPRHLWGKVAPEELAKGNVQAYPPLGWGPYVFKEWSSGNYISLERNASYFRFASQNLPRFDTLTFLFVKDAVAGISALVSGQCDMLDTSLRLESEIDLLTELQRSEQVKLLTSTTPLIERLDFGIVPSAYDDLSMVGDRVDLFGDVRTRQGIAFCLDRKKVVTTVLAGLSAIPETFVAPSHPYYNPNTAKFPFDPNSGSAMLTQAGWLDDDNDAGTPRVADGVKNVPNGTKLVVSYWTTSALQRRQVSEILADSLSQCGVGVDIKYYSQDEFYASGPEGPLFGRKFDLAEYALGTIGTEPPCSWFVTSQVPTKFNKWLGINISGYTNADYDALCAQGMRSLPGSAEYKDAYDKAQVIFANDLPSVPLYVRIKAAATRRDMCNFALDAFAVNDLWNVEEFEFGPACGQ